MKLEYAKRDNTARDRLAILCLVLLAILVGLNLHRCEYEPNVAPVPALPPVGE